MKEAIYAAKVYLTTLVGTIIVLLIILIFYARLANLICSVSWMSWYCTNTFVGIIIHVLFLLGVLRIMYMLALKYVPQNRPKKIIIDGKEVEEKVS